MPRLVIAEGQNVGRAFDLSEEILMGRGDGIDILVSDPKASRRHARIYQQDNAWYIEDLGSTNGTFIDQARVKEALRLKHGDRIRIGGQIFIFEKEGGGGSETTRKENLRPVLAGGNESTFDSTHIETAMDARSHVLVDETLKVKDSQEATRLHSRLRLWYNIGRSIGSILDMSKLLDEITEQLLLTFDQSDRAVVLLPQSEDLDDLAIKTTKWRKGLEDGDIPVSTTIVERSVHEKQAVLSADTQSDERFIASKSIRELNILSIICTPLFLDGKLLGMVYLDKRSSGKPFSEEDLSLLAGIADVIALAIENASVHSRLRRIREQLEQDNVSLRREISGGFSLDSIVGAHPKMREILSIAKRISDTTTSVLITGESGTGKELIAKAIHYSGERAPRPFVPINCAAMPAELLESELFGIEKGVATSVDARIGLIEHAQGGTLLLDEISSMSLPMQAKLLRVLQERAFRRVGGRGAVPFDVRIIAATNQDLHVAMVKEEFRADLFHRLNVVPIYILPLRERQEDIMPLAEHFLDEFCRAMNKKIAGFTAEAVEFLQEHDWPGNVRQLRNSIERAVALAPHDGLIEPERLDPARDAFGDKVLAAGDSDNSGPVIPAPLDALRKSGSLPQLVKEIEIDLIKRVLGTTNGHKVRAVEMLGISREGLRKKMKRYGLQNEKVRK